jgi:hypothetical protein
MQISLCKFECDTDLGLLPVARRAGHEYLVLEPCIIFIWIVVGHFIPEELDGFASL